MLVSNLFKTPFHIIFPLKGYALCFGCMVLLFIWVLFGMFWEVVLSFGCCWGISFMGHVKKKAPFGSSSCETHLHSLKGDLEHKASKKGFHMGSSIIQSVYSTSPFFSFYLSFIFFDLFWRFLSKVKWSMRVIISFGFHRFAFILLFNIFSFYFSSLAS